MKSRLESVLGALFVAASAVTTFWPAWIERLTGLDPDGGSGAVEWALPAVFGCAAAIMFMLARRHRSALAS